MKYCLHQKIHLILQQPSTQNLHRNLLQHLLHDLHHQKRNMGEVAVSKNLIQKKSIRNYCLHQKIHLILQQNSNQNLHRNLLQHLHLYLHYK